jgi:ribosome maturation factor RimP
MSKEGGRFSPLFFWKSMTTELSTILEQAATDIGFDLVLWRLIPDGRGRVLQIMAEPKDGTPMTLTACGSLSRALSPLLDTLPDLGEYSLEVSSPGIDRPLVKHTDFEKFKGERIKLETIKPLDGRKKYTGLLIQIDNDGQIHMDVDGQAFVIPFTLVHKAHLDRLSQLALKKERKHA